MIEIINKIKDIPKLKLAFFIIADILFISSAVYLAFLVKFDLKTPERYYDAIEAVIVLALVFCIPIFYFMKLYSFSWSYVSMNELFTLFKAITLGFLFVGVSLYLSRDYHLFIGFPRSTLLFSYVLAFVFTGGIRLSKRIYLQLFQGGRKEEKRKTLIVGAGDAGEQILRNILTSRNTPYFTVGFADDDNLKQGMTIHGLKVLGRIDDIPKLAKKYGIEELIIALPSAGSQAIRSAVEKGREAGLKSIKVVPSMAEVISGEASIRDLREIQIEDLLGREPVYLNTKSIESFIRDKAVLITGAAGSIGSELSKQSAKFKPKLLVLLDQDETGIFNISRELRKRFRYLDIKSIIADIRNKEKMHQIFSQFRPEVIFHAAAYKHVPLMEAQPEEAIRNNIFGTETVAKTALNFKAEKFIMISTDKAVNPTSVMGASKRVGEMICHNLNQKNSTKFISVRFGNVLDSRGSVIPVFREQIKRGGPIEVTHPDMKRYFMTIPEACLLVMQAGAMGQGGEVFVLDMGKPMPIVDLAKEMIRLAGFEADKDIPIVFTEPRPGEKFFEEILTAEEGTIATQNQKIFMARFSEVDEIKLNQALENLKQASHNADKEKIADILKMIIPYYNPQKKGD